MLHCGATWRTSDEPRELIYVTVRLSINRARPLNETQLTITKIETLLDRQSHVVPNSPERLSQAHQLQLSHVASLELLLADEVCHGGESRSAALRSTKAGLDQSMRIDTWIALDDLRYDRSLLSDRFSLRFAEAGHSVLVGAGWVWRSRCDGPIDWQERGLSPLPGLLSGAPAVFPLRNTQHLLLIFTGRASRLKTC